jgi:hypothetical protein
VRIIDIELVFEDGSTPVTATAAAQSSHIRKGEDVTYRLTCIGSDGTARDITAHEFTLGITSDAAGTTSVIRNTGVIDGAAADGIALAVVEESDTADLDAQTYYLSVLVNDGTYDWQPLPRSPVTLLPSSCLPVP